MTARTFEDDPSIADEERLFRRIPRTWINWDDHGNAAVSSAAFRDEELSVALESVMARDGRPPVDAIRNYPGYGLAAITAAHARSLNQRVARDPLDEEPAHGVVYGPKKRGGIASKLRDGASWVITPAPVASA
jgi:hypothetical protein